MTKGFFSVFTFFSILLFAICPLFWSLSPPLSLCLYSLCMWFGQLIGCWRCHPPLIYNPLFKSGCFLQSLSYIVSCSSTSQHRSPWLFWEYLMILSLFNFLFVIFPDSHLFFNSSHRIQITFLTYLNNWNLRIYLLLIKSPYTNGVSVSTDYFGCKSYTLFFRGESFDAVAI